MLDEVKRLRRDVTRIEMKIDALSAGHAVALPTPAAETEFYDRLANLLKPILDDVAALGGRMAAVEATIASARQAAAEVIDPSPALQAAAAEPPAPASPA